MGRPSGLRRWRFDHHTIVVLYILAASFVTLRSLVDGGVAGLTRFTRSKFKQSWVDSSIGYHAGADDKSKAGEPKSQKNSRNPLKAKKGKVQNSTDVVGAEGGGSYSSTDVQHLCIDMNQFLHSSFRRTTTSKHFLAKIYSGIDKILNNIKPRETLVLVFDGSAPFAKMQTQRLRRSTQPENSLLTPGTDFMNQMEDVMICYVLQRIQKTQFQNLTVFISGADTPGEGELKIVDWITTKLPHHDDRVVICGSDSDIILQSICMSLYATNITVFQVGSDYNDAFCNVTHLIGEIVDYALAPAWFESKTEQQESEENPVLNTRPEGHQNPVDLVALFVLQGNDYLPKLRGVSMPTTLKAYGRVVRQLAGDSEKYAVDSNSLIDIESESFNFHALWLLMREIEVEREREGFSHIALPFQIPTSLQSLHTFFQRKNYDKSDVVWIDEQETVVGKAMWRCKLSLPKGKSYETQTLYTYKKAARLACASMALLDLDPSSFAETEERAEEVKAEMRKVRQSVIDEQRAKNRRLVVPESSAESFLSLVDDALIGDDAEGDSEYSGDSDGGDGDSGDAALEERSSKGACVSNGEYAKYVKDADIESYLQGLLWVVRMYRAGVCPDVSYSYHSRPPISPFSIAKYIERVLVASSNSKAQMHHEMELSRYEDLLSLGLRSKEVVAPLHQSVKLPVSSAAKPLSAAATCACVIPPIGAAFVPTYLQDIWFEMQEKMAEKTLMDIDYFETCAMLESAWGGVKNRSVSLSANIVNPSQASAQSQLATKRTAASTLKSRAVLNNIIALTKSAAGVRRSETKIKRKGAPAGAIHAVAGDWTVITREVDVEVLHATYNKHGAFRHYYLDLPLPVPFDMPDRLPRGVRVYKTPQTVTGQLGKKTSDH